MPLEVREDKLADAEEFRRDWERLRRASPFAGPFMLLDWILEGHRRFGPPGDRVRLLRFMRPSGECAAMGVLASRRSGAGLASKRVLRSIEYNTQRALPLLAASEEDLADALAALHGRHARGFDSFDFYKLDAMGGGLDRVAGRLRGQGIDARIEPHDEQPRMRLASTWEETRQIRGKKGWKSLGASRRRIEEAAGPVSLVRHRAPEDFQGEALERALASMEEVFALSWQHEVHARGEGPDPAAMFDFHAELSRMLGPLGLVDLAFLMGGGRPVAWDWNLVEDGVVYLVFGGYDGSLRRAGPGALLLAELLRDGQERGDRLIEFGGGFLDYKMKWATEVVPSHRLRLRGSTLKARIAGWLP